jgi:CRISPR/Cas system CSM-associated protein Csm3 (group 7 of RAMP superfamily)
MDRWLVIGELTTTAPLHIGSGHTTERPDLVRRKGNDRQTDEVDVSAIVTDCTGRAYVPGSTLKGTVRSWLARRVGSATLDEAFGSPDTGGKAEFLDARVKAWAIDATPPYWSSERLTGVAASVAIDRLTRTARDERLFHVEYVPPGVAFEIRIRGDGLTEDEVRLLLAGLGGFNASEPVTLGGGTADGWGRMAWELEGVRRLNAEGAAAWLKAGAREAGDGIFVHGQPWTPADAFALRTHPRSTLVVQLALHFEAAFLVNDPWRTREDPSDARGARPPDHAPLLDRNRRAFLPARSFRGALRSQAERILRTLGARACDGGTCGPVKEAATLQEALADLCAVCRVFGAAGWKSPLVVSDFTSASDVEEVRQEFLAIDRFTGGGAPHLKFNALRAYRPVLQGRIGADLATLDRAGIGAWALGLLALALRDLLEGDMVFGLGASKGFGACRAEIIAVERPDWEGIPLAFRRGLDADATRVVDLKPPALDSPEGLALLEWIVELEDRVHGRARGAE